MAEAKIKFAISYSCGKDSALALWRMLKAGHAPVALVVNINQELNRSWFHGIDMLLLSQISRSLAIPLIKAPSSGHDYHLALEQALREARGLGAQACVFGDLDNEQHLQWDQERCESAGLECVMPLWQEKREALMAELIEDGFQAVVKAVQMPFLGPEFLGKAVTWTFVEKLRAAGVDICGENGEYHTLVYNGPIFRYPVPIKLGHVLHFNNHSVINIMAADVALKQVGAYGKSYP